MHRGMNYGNNSKGKMNSTITQRTKKEIDDSLELLSIRDLERLANKLPWKSPKVVKILGRKFKKNETHLAAKRSLVNLSLSKDGSVAELAKRTLFKLEGSWANKSVNINGRNITTLSEFKNKKEVGFPEQQKTSKKKNTSRRYR